jgi:2-methylcitrate dehydratase PrpD
MCSNSTLAETLQADADRLLLAIVLGYDVMGRVGEAALLPRQRGASNRDHGSVRLSGCRRRSAWPYTTASGSDCKPLHAGRAAETGINAAKLARRGLHGPATIFEGKSGFLSAFVGEPRPELMCVELGQRFAILESAFKIHASSGGCFTAIDAAIRLRAEHVLDPAAIDRVRVALPRWVTQRPGYKLGHPTSPGDSRRSVLFVVAVAFVYGEVTHRQHTPETLADPRITAFEQRIQFVDDAEIERIFEANQSDPQFHVPCAVEIDSAGRTFRQLEELPVGYSLRRALTTDQVTAKFQRLVDGVIPSTQAARLVEWALGLGAGSRVGDLAAIASVG